MIKDSELMYNVVLYISLFLWSLTLNIIADKLVVRPKTKKYFLFPLFELFMTLSFVMLWQSSAYFLPYFILFSALGITIQTDLSCMLISRFVSLYLAPTGIMLSYYDMLPINWHESLISAIIGYSFFYLINKIFFMLKKQNGLGQGDFDLMALIGAYTGLLGIWFTILVASIIGTIAGLLCMLYNKRTIACLPFGPFLSLATLLFVVFHTQIIAVLVHN